MMLFVSTGGVFRPTSGRSTPGMRINHKTNEQTTSMDVEVRNCGLARYRDVMELQYQLRDQRAMGQIADTVLLVEHEPVITLGARQSANKLLADDGELAERGIEVVAIRRGGGTTAHNPGQLVFYPIMNLQQRGLGISDYVRKLEAVGIELLGRFNVGAERKKGFPGLWVGGRKIASVGVRVSRFITYHGMAINICNDLSIFELIVPCGLGDVEMTSVLKETGKSVSVDVSKAYLTEIIRDHFGADE